MSDELSMRDTLEATFKEIEEREEEEEVVAPEPEKEPEPEPEPEEEVPEKAEEPEEPKAPEPVKPAVEDKSLIPPSTWTPKAKAKWEQIDPEIRAEIKRREAAAAKGIAQYKETAAYGERFSKAIQPYQAFLKARNTTPESAVENALDLAYRLSSGTPQEKGVILRRIAQQYGADLTAQANPEQDKLQQYIQPLVQQIEELRRERLNSQTLTEQQRTQQLNSMVEEFSSKTDETGRLAHPYFEDVKGFMASLLESGSAQTLDEAYALAVETHPATREIVKAEKVTRELQSKKQNEQVRTDKAKRNQQVNFQPRPVQSSKAATPSTMRESMEAAYARVMGQS